MANRSHPHPRKPWLSPSWLSLDGWAVLAATVLIALILVGVLPHVPW
jgi:hypothetical protein